MEFAAKISLLKPIRLELKKELAGPYVRLLRRPAPEVDALATGKTTVLIRGARLVHAAPLWPGLAACYYAQGRQGGWHSSDFQEEQWARSFVGPGPMIIRLLIVPQAYLRLTNDDSIGEIAEELGPWKREPIDAWRKGLHGGICLSVVRVYEFNPIKLQEVAEKSLHLLVKPFSARGLKPILSDEIWEQNLEDMSRLLEEKVVQKRALQQKAATYHKSESVKKYTIEAMSRETGRSVETIAQWQRMLLRKKQLIFSGPPGTGKTFIAERLAQLIADSEGGIREMLQFHPAYSYEDFVQGIRPQARGNRVVYEWEEGAFMRFCRRARQKGERPCVLLLDEVNRAPLARVLGELLYLLEYRESSLELAGSGTLFSVPNNVLIIGTMNTADRSIALVDQAIIRRFSFVRLQVDTAVLANYLRRYGLNPEVLIILLEEVNKRIGHADLELGIAPFMKDGAELPQYIGEIWQGEVEPYLEEAFYDRPEEMAKFRWPGSVQQRLKLLGN